MGKILFWLVVVSVIILIMKAVGRKRVPPPEEHPKEVEDMVRCRVCGVNLPRSEAILSHGRFYCSQEHRKQDSA